MQWWRRRRTSHVSSYLNRLTRIRNAMYFIAHAQVNGVSLRAQRLCGTNRPWGRVLVGYVRLGPPQCTRVWLWVIVKRVGGPQYDLESLRKPQGNHTPHDDECP